MLLKCFHCRRPLAKFTVQLGTEEAPYGYGPKCAERVVVRKRRQRKPRAAAPRVRRRRVHDAQLSLEFA